MPTKKILAIAPVLPQASDIESIAKTVSFLHDEYQVDFLDPLMIMQQVSNDDYYQLWKNELGKRVANYDGFLGFSFGGVIVQQCFSLFSTINKPIILVSTPTRADAILAKKLGNVVNRCKENRVNEALELLYSDVFYPNSAPVQAAETGNTTIAINRLLFGLTRVLETDSSKIVEESLVNYLHLIGEHSQLVNRNNVLAPNDGRLLIVPKAGMRVLEDNPSFCQQLIMESLRCEIT